MEILIFGIIPLLCVVIFVIFEMIDNRQIKKKAQGSKIEKEEYSTADWLGFYYGV